jgi:Spy/CpxP family protein refolding chaperone
MTRSAVVRTIVGLVVGGLAVGVAAVGASQAQPPVQLRGQMAMRSRGVVPAGLLAGMRRELSQLGLSDEQKRQVKSIVQAKNTELKRFRDQMREARLSVASAIVNDEGEAAIRARSAELSRLQADLAVFRSELRRQIAGVLTPDQQAKAKQLRLRALERAGRFIQRRKVMLNR